MYIYMYIEKYWPEALDNKFQLVNFSTLRVKNDIEKNIQDMDNKSMVSCRYKFDAQENYCT